MNFKPNRSEPASPAPGDADLLISSLQNERIKEVVKLRRRTHRDENLLLIIEGYRELKRALDNRRRPATLYYCEELFLGHNERDLIALCRAAGAECFRCTTPVFQKIAYRDRPEGLLAIAPQLRLTLADLKLSGTPLVLVTESIEKPGNLGTLLRSADAAGADAVIVCDERTDIHNPNVVRASIGTLFTIPVIETSSEKARNWLRERGIRLLAASPHAQLDYTEVDMQSGLAIVVGAEQVGLSGQWMQEADLQARIPMRGQADSLNVAAAATILLFEARRQRRHKP